MTKWHYCVSQCYFNVFIISEVYTFSFQISMQALSLLNNVSDIVLLVSSLAAFRQVAALIIDCDQTVKRLWVRVWRSSIDGKRANIQTLPFSQTHTRHVQYIPTLLSISPAFKTLSLPAVIMSSSHEVTGCCIVCLIYNWIYYGFSWN